jgi:gamma-butyrobetaine dioxygenase
MSELMTFSWDATTLALEMDGAKRVCFPAVWLRDQCHESHGWSSAQRRIDIFDLPADPRIESVSRNGELLEIRWTGEEGLTSVPISWLEAVARPLAPRALRLWTADHASALSWAEFTALLAERTVRMGWLKAILQDGIAFLRGVPPAEEEVLLAAAVLGYPVETNYGRVFQVRPEPAPDNLAYTAAGLGLHTDNPYREPVPGYQILHCLIADTEGGESIFADGYAIAEKLRGDDPEAFSALTTIPVDFRYRDASTELTAWRTLIELDREGRIARIHWNNRSMSTARLPLHRAEGFYRAYRTFAAMLRSPEFIHRIRLQPGELVAFDNGRVLHGRTSFSGERLLQGCYVNRDGAASNLAVLRRELAEEIIQLMIERGGRSYFGEAVSQLEHALQAAWLASLANSDLSLIVAALLHDVGHLLHDLPERIADDHIDTKHEELGYEWLLACFGPAVAEPVRDHVAAKRYLCLVDPEYLAQLSPASVQSLALQGGPFSQEEAHAFEQLPRYREAVQLRRWDDAAKQPGLAVPTLQHYRPLLAERVS